MQVSSTLVAEALGEPACSVPAHAQHPTTNGGMIDRKLFQITQGQAIS
jgi:hypothetical protein